MAERRPSTISTGSPSVATESLAVVRDLGLAWGSGGNWRAPEKRGFLRRGEPLAISAWRHGGEAMINMRRKSEGERRRIGSGTWERPAAGQDVTPETVRDSREPMPTFLARRNKVCDESAARVLTSRCWPAPCVPMEEHAAGAGVVPEIASRPAHVDRPAPADRRGDGQKRPGLTVDLVRFAAPAAPARPACGLHVTGRTHGPPPPTSLPGHPTHLEGPASVRCWLGGAYCRRDAYSSLVQRAATPN